MTQFILSPKSLDYLNLRSIYFINSPHLVYVSRQSQLFVVLFSCQVEDMSSDNLPDLHGANFSLLLPHASSGYKLAWLFASSERKSSLSRSDLLVVSLLLPCEWQRYHSGWKQKLREQAGSDCFRKKEVVSFSATQTRRWFICQCFFQGHFSSSLESSTVISTSMPLHTSCLIVNVHKDLWRPTGKQCTAVLAIEHPFSVPPQKKQALFSHSWWLFLHCSASGSLCDFCGTCAKSKHCEKAGSMVHIYRASWESFERSMSNPSL